tara:strand:- start:26254 stop:26511 length:258 start_codon:yes stop_codon:yes gene_type:complete
MDKLPIEIQNKNWGLYYSHIYYTNVVLELHKRINKCNQIVNNEINWEKNNTQSQLEYYNKLFSDIHDKDWVKQRLFQISFFLEGK